MKSNPLRIIWSEESIEDLRSIHKYLKARSEKLAFRQIKNILEREEQILNFPLAGSTYYSEGLGIKFRFLIEGNYKIIYRIDDAYIVISAIFDTRQDPDNLNYIKEPQAEFSKAATK